MYEFEKKIKKLTSKRDLVNPDFHEQSQKLFDNYIKQFKDQSSKLVVVDTDWGDKIEIHISEISAQLDREISTARDTEMTKLQELTKKAF